MANVTELFERMAYYACLIYLVVYLSREVGFDDSQAGTIAALFAFFSWLLPAFMGALADKWGFRIALAMAYTFLTIGYFLLGGFDFIADELDDFTGFNTDHVVVMDA